MRFEVTPELADRYGLDREACRGVPFGAHPWQREPYAVRWPGPEEPREIRGVHVTGWHNFGNMVVQLVHALAFAERHGIEVVTGPENPWFRRGRAAGVRLALGRPPRRPALVGKFFYLQPLGLTALDRGPQHIRPLRRLFALNGEPPRAAEDLVVHLRSGDVFGPSPHPVYWPPALDYYRAAVLQSGARSVRLVSQDRQHPLLEPLRQWCAGRGITCEVQVSDLAEDLRALTSARMLCLSQGTMGMTAAWLSRTVRTVFVPFADEARELVALGVEVYAAGSTNPPDREPWTASSGQIAGLLAADGQTRLARVETAPGDAVRR